MSAGGNIRVELHWRLTGRHFTFPVRMSQMWSHLEKVQVGGFAISSLPPAELILYLCMHGSRHGWERLQWICDIAEFVRLHAEIDWEDVWHRAQDLGNERNLALGLLLAKEFLDAPVPDAVMKRVNKDETVKTLTMQIREWLFSEAVTTQDISYWHDYHLKVRERLWDRMKVRLHYYSRYLRIATSPNIQDRAFVALPARLSVLYYLLRPIRLVKTYGSAWFGRFGKTRG
jgi:hypothetical protein